MASGVRPNKKPGVPSAVVSDKLGSKDAKSMTSAQRIEAATVKKTSVTMTDVQSRDAEALFTVYDSVGTGLLTRGALTELLRDIGLEKALERDFQASSRLAFDAHSADSHFLALAEFKQLYYRIAGWHPQLLPRTTALNISLMGARGLPPADTNGKSDPFVICHVLDANGKLKKKSISQTRVIEKTLDPWWGEEHDDKYCYESEEDSLYFEVHDFDKGDKSELLCSAKLPSSEFHRPGGFDGPLALTCVPGTPKGFNPTLKLRVVVNGLPCPPPPLKIQILRAWGLPPADPNGKADPFCTCMLIGKPYSKSKTAIKQKTLEPEWNEEFDDKYRYEEGDNIIFEVFDYDKGGKCDLLGRVIMPGSYFHKPGGFDGNLTLTDTEKRYEPKLALRVFIRDLEEAVDLSVTGQAVAVETPTAAATPAAEAPPAGGVAASPAAAGA